MDLIILPTPAPQRPRRLPPPMAYAVSLSLVAAANVAAIVSIVAAHSRRRAMDAWNAADQATALEGLAKTLVAASGRASAAKAAAETLGRLFNAAAVVLLQEEDERLKVSARAGLARLSKADEE